MFCPKCGRKFNDNAFTFCPNCGAAVSGNSTKPNPPVSPAAGGAASGTQYIIFALIAANVFTAFTTLFKVFSIRSSYGDTIGTRSFTDVTRKNKVFLRRVAESFNIKYDSKDIFYTFITIIVYAMAIAGAVCLILIVKDIISKRFDKNQLNMRILKKLLISSIASIGQVICILIFMMTEDNGRVSFTAWFYILGVVSVSAMFAEMYLLRSEQ